jgi:pyruvate kinase
MSIQLPSYKTKIVCTIGPASRAPAVLEELIKNGMNVARLNLSHGSFSEHRENIRNLRRAAAKLRRPLSIIIDLPGVKMRIGNLRKEPLIIKKGEKVTLTTKDIIGSGSIIPVSYKHLPRSVSKGSIIYLSDGFIQLKVEQIAGPQIHCRVVIGGPLLSHKGLNLPGAKLFVDPITSTDLATVAFGLQNGVTVFGLSFVQKAADILKVREFARRKGKDVYLVAKIERREAIENFEEILRVADAVMIARGDLGIEIPIEEVPVVQKQLIRKANISGRPVITATQMLGSMTHNVRPTRAEVNDVANAIVDGTDAVMLSEETAIGEFPLDAVRMMASIAASAEHLCHTPQFLDEMRERIRMMRGEQPPRTPDVISVNVVRAAGKLKARYILTQSSSGSTARHISRFKPDCWILSFSSRAVVSELLNFSYGVYPFLTDKKNARRPEAIIRTVKAAGLLKKGDTVIISERRFSSQPGNTDSLGVMTLD